MAEEVTSRPSTIPWDRVVVVVVGFFGTFAGLAYYLGKEYSDAYYGRLGIPPSAISLSPPEYMVASERFLLFVLFSLVSMGIIILLPTSSGTAQPQASTGELSWAWQAARTVVRGIQAVWWAIVKAVASVFPGQKEVTAQWRLAYDLAIRVHVSFPIVILVGYSLVEVIPPWAPFPLFLGYTAFTLGLREANKPLYVLSAAIVVLFGGVAFLTMAPDALGERDADKILDDPSRLPRAEIQWEPDVAIPIPADLTSETSNVRVVVTNEDTHYVIVEGSEELEIFAIPTRIVHSIRYTPDRD